jgi:hypothetical protein
MVKAAENAPHFGSRACPWLAIRHGHLMAKLPPAALPEEKVKPARTRTKVVFLRLNERELAMANEVADAHALNVTETLRFLLRQAHATLRHGKR